METWTRTENGGWKSWKHPGLGLDALTRSAKPVATLLVVAGEPEDDEQLLAAVRLARRLATGRLEIVAGSVHPTARWLEAVQVAGADRALLVARPERHRLWGSPQLDDAVELGTHICPELHATQEQGTALSVCGTHRDRMVLAWHHFERWCLRNKEDCPHWRGAHRG